LVCALAAGLVSFAWPDRYVSSAQLRFRPRYVPEQAIEGRRVAIKLRVNTLVADVLSRSSLVRIIQSPGIDLYTRERRSAPLEDVVDTMRKQVRVHGDDPGATAFRISFEYADARTAQLAVRALVTTLIDRNVEINRSAAPPEYLEIVDPATLPERSAGPDRYAIAGIGLGVGFGLGVAAFGMRRILRRRASGMTAAALAGLAVAGGATFLLPGDKFADLVAWLPFAGLGAAAGLLAWAVLRDGRAAWRRPHYGWSALAGGALGAITAGLVAYVIPVRYESTAVLRMYAAAGTMTPAEDARERLAEITNEVLSRSSLSELVLRPSLDLYSRGRQRRPLEEIVGNMRANDLRIEPTFKTSSIPGPILPARISFAYADRLKAQAVVREIVTKFIEGNVAIEKERSRGATRQGTIVMDVLDPASLPEEPLFPQSAATMATAAGAGAGLAWLLAFLRRRPRGQAAAMLKMSAAGGAAGAVLAGAIAFAIPARYVSTAVLMIRPGTGRQVTAAHVADYVRQETPVILSRSSLVDLIRRPALDLYRGERARHPMEQVIDKMREDLRIDSPAPAPLATTFSIEFTYSDRAKAQAVVRELVTKLVESHANYVKRTPGLDPVSADAARLEVLDTPSPAQWHGNMTSGFVPDLADAAVRKALDARSPAPWFVNKTAHIEPFLADEARLEVLDPASLPEAPVWPPRGGIIAGGLLAGLLLGLAIAANQTPSSRWPSFSFLVRR
jgi:uncharacterized protein involved in exopolysaccharide biosynthesis